MARGRDKHDAHKDALNALGRPLSRRARSACELCGEGGPLRVFEVSGGPAEPDEDWAILSCERCAKATEAKTLEPTQLRFLETAVWAETRPAQVLAVRLTKRLADQGVAWARDCVDGLYLDPEVEGRV